MEIIINKNFRYTNGGGLAVGGDDYPHTESFLPHALSNDDGPLRFEQTMTVCFKLAANGDARPVPITPIKGYYAWGGFRCRGSEWEDYAC
ncbi:MAG: hypothetical protein RR394_03465 [Oscillospiraceae bacterium]